MRGAIVSRVRALKTPAESFFYDHAGFSYAPDEPPENGKRRCAIALARAEARAHKRQYVVRWSIDPGIDSSDFSDELPVWSLWQAACYDANGEIQASLHGIDFGRDGHPDSDAYARVVAAELYQEALDRNRK
jgi:hypothetical protein